MSASGDATKNQADTRSDLESEVLQALKLCGTFNIVEAIVAIIKKRESIYDKASLDLNALLDLRDSHDAWKWKARALQAERERDEWRLSCEQSDDQATRLADRLAEVMRDSDEARAAIARVRALPYPKAAIRYALDGDAAMKVKTA